MAISFPPGPPSRLFKALAGSRQADRRDRPQRQGRRQQPGRRRCTAWKAASRRTVTRRFTWPWATIPPASAWPSTWRKRPSWPSRPATHSPVTATADVVLPVEMWAEQEGHYRQPGRPRPGRPARPRPPPEGVRSNLAVLADLAGRLGLPAPPLLKSNLAATAGRDRVTTTWALLV